MKSKEGEDTLKEHKTRLYFATGNEGKYAEVARMAAGFGIRLEQLKGSKFEIQSDDLQEIAAFAAKHACEASHRSVVAEDSGFFVQGLGGFPGPYSAYVYRAIGNDGILKLLRSSDRRDAYFQASVAYCEPKQEPVCFRGIAKGTVGRRSIGKHGFGFDPIFKPTRGDGRTFAEMSADEKNQLSHRAKAFTKLFEWLIM